MGRSLSEVMAQPYIDVVHPEDWAAPIRKLRDIPRQKTITKCVPATTIEMESTG